MFGQLQDDRCPAIPPPLAAVHPCYRGCGNPSAEEGDSRVHVERIQKALQDLGSDCQDVVRTRIYVTDISRSSEYTQAHQEFFGAHPPTSTMVEVRALVDPEMLVEIEAEAICDS